MCVVNFICGFLLLKSTNVEETRVCLRVKNRFTFERELLVKRSSAINRRLGHFVADNPADINISNISTNDK